MDDAQGLFFFVLFWWLLAEKAGYVGAAIAFRTLLPDAHERVLETYRRRPYRCAIFGLINLTVISFVVVALVSSRVLALPGILIGAATILLTVGAYAPAYADLGARWMPLGQDGRPPVRATLLGGATLESAFFVPIAGQLMSLAVLVRGFGAVVAVLFSLRRRTDAAIAANTAPAESQ